MPPGCSPLPLSGYFAYDAETRSSAILRRHDCMRKLGMGVLGVGEMGKQHALNLRHLVPQAKLVAIADVDGARASKVAEELEIDNAYSSLEAMLECKEIQAVLIATPDNFHAAAVETVARAGKDMLCEKPLGVNVESAQN